MLSLGNQRKRVYSPRQFNSLVSWVMEHGEASAPRGIKTTEILNANLIVRNPRDRIVFDPARKMNIAFAIAETIMLLAGNDELGLVTPFVPNMTEFSADGKTIGGAYGPRLQSQGVSQITEVIRTLRDDPDSRQAILTIRQPQDFLSPPHLVPCTLSIQFLIRQGHLHAITTMRSNDVIWGLTYDLFVFTMLQEFIANRLGLPLGWYFHNAGSLHLYTERDKKIINNLGSRNTQLTMRAGRLQLPQQMLGGLRESLDLSSRKIWDRVNDYQEEGYTLAADLILVLRHHVARKEAPYEAAAALAAIKDPALKKVTKLWKIRRVNE